MLVVLLISELLVYWRLVPSIDGEGYHSVLVWFLWSAWFSRSLKKQSNERTVNEFHGVYLSFKELRLRYSFYLPTWLDTR